MKKYFLVTYLVAGEGTGKIEFYTTNPNQTMASVRIDAKHEVARQTGIPESKITLMAVEPLN